MNVGTRVSTDYGPGEVSEHTSRRVLIALDSGEVLNIVTGTPGYFRIEREVSL